MKFRTMMLATALLINLFGVVFARAEVWDVNTMLELYQILPTEDRLKIEYEDGLGWANSELTIVRKASPFYCTPNKIALTGSQFVDIVQQAREDDPSIGKQFVGLGLLRSLERVFPCPR